MQKMMTGNAGRQKWLVYVAVLFFTLHISPVPSLAANEDYKEEAEYLALRDSMRHAFNDGDSTRFFVAVKALQDYLLTKNDLHAYYTQRCNEIVFNLNRQNIFDAYKLATKLSKELTEKKLDREMYMAINMMGHIYKYCGNNESAKNCFREVLKRMKREGYIESMPPIYINLVGIYSDENSDSALILLDTALQLAKDYSPERTFDIEARRALSYYKMGDREKFLEGYASYKKGLENGLSSVHGRQLDICYQSLMGNTEKAVKMAMEELDGSEKYSVAADIYEKAGNWQEANKALRMVMAVNDSVNSVILDNSMQGIQDELKLSEAQQSAAKSKLIAMTAVLSGLLLMTLALAYFAYIKRRHERQLKKAYMQALETDKMKSAFIQNVSHEVRTPLNIISGFAQVIANPELSQSVEDRKKIAETMMLNTQLITTLIDETLELSKDEQTGKPDILYADSLRTLLQQLLQDIRSKLNPGVVCNFEHSLPAGFTMNTQKELFKRVVMLLLDNAAKNTQEGSITLRAKADKRLLSLVVEDTGCGIPAKEAEHIFERFVKLNDFKKGLGLGLPLCRTLVSKMDGKVWLDTSYSGPGARFCIELPLH